MILPSAVRFFSGITCRLLLLNELLRLGWYGDGREEDDVKAGALRRPNGSLYSETLDNRRIEPGTSSVSSSFSMPMFHFAGLFSTRCSISDMDVRLLGLPLFFLLPSMAFQSTRLFAFQSCAAALAGCEGPADRSSWPWLS